MAWALLPGRGMRLQVKCRLCVVSERNVVLVMFSEFPFPSIVFWRSGILSWNSAQ
jgi:hypothetical protein